MDQDAFRATYRDVNERACVFERAVLTNQCHCSQADRFCIAEREGVACRSQSGHEQCAEFVALLREHARFALSSPKDQDTEGLPYGKAMRVQVGGLRGLAELLDGPQPGQPAVNDVHALVSGAIHRFGDLNALPYSALMPQIAAYRGRQRSRKRKPR